MIAGILLAAGRSRRFGSQKLLIPYTSGLTLFEHVLRVYLCAGIDPLVVVVSREIMGRFFRGEVPQPSSFRIDSVGSAPWMRLHTPWGRARLMVNRYPERGMSTSLTLGLRGLEESERRKGVLVSLADMPKVTPALVQTLAGIYQRKSADMVVPTYRGQTGHPVIFREPRYRQAIKNIRGDKGLRDIIRSNKGKIVYVPWPDDAVVTDVDTTSDLNRIFQQGVMMDGN